MIDGSFSGSEGRLCGGDRGQRVLYSLQVGGHKHFGGYQPAISRQLAALR
jgi:hypothetical protein